MSKRGPRISGEEGSPKGLASLTDRERQVVRLIFEKAMSSREIGEHLGISHRTVEVLRHRAGKKLDAHSPAQLFRVCCGLSPRDESDQPDLQF